MWLTKFRSWGHVYLSRCIHLAQYSTCKCRCERVMQGVAEMLNLPTRGGDGARRYGSLHFWEASSNSKIMVAICYHDFRKSWLVWAGQNKYHAQISKPFKQLFPTSAYCVATERVINHRECIQEVKVWLYHHWLLKYQLKWIHQCVISLHADVYLCYVCWQMSIGWFGFLQVSL